MIEAQALSFPAGALPKMVRAAGRTDLKAVSLVDLSAELLARLAAGDRFNGSDQFQLAHQLEEKLATATDDHLNRFAAQRHYDLLTPVLSCVTEEELTGATIVDLGCGSLNPFAFSFILLMLGAKRAYAIDLEPIQDMAIATRALATAAGWLLLDSSRVVGAQVPAETVLKNLAGFNLPLLTNGNPAGIAADRLSHHVESIYDLSTRDGEADIVFSVSLFEHLDRVEDALESLRRITRVGGLGVHVIDFVDHRMYSPEPVSPFEFLKLASSEPLVHGCNRTRCDQFAALFEQHGFGVEQLQRWAHLPPPTDQEHAQFVEPYRSMSRENVATTGARFTVRRRS